MKARKKNVSRISALVLALIMMLSLVPTAVFATDGGAEETTYVLAGGDFQEGDWDANGDGVVTQHEASAQNVSNILAQISQHYPTMDGFLFTGDYDGDTHGDTQQANAGITALMNTVQATYANINYDNSVLVEGNHDPIVGNIDATGGQDFDGYSVYLINEDDYPEAGSGESTVQTVANNLQAWLAEREDSAKPIFVITHVPLAYGTRTYNRGDGKYAKYLFDVLNEAGAKGQNIIFLHGHDHAYGCDNPLGGEAIYLPKGDTIRIANVGSTTQYQEYTLNFTYMNSGYVGYYNESGYTIDERDDHKLTMSVFAITGNQVTVERYNAYGLYNMKSAGRDGYYNNTNSAASKIGLPINETVYSSPQTIQLANVEQSFEDASGSGITVTTKSGTGLTVSVLPNTTPYDNIDEYVLYDIAVTDFVQGNKAVVSIPVPDSFAGSKIRVYHVDENGKLVNMKATVKNGVAAFTTTHFSQYMLAKLNDSAPTTLDWVPIPGESNYQLVNNGANGIVSGENYLIVSSNSGNAYALNSDGGRQSVSISNNVISNLSDSSCVFKLVTNGSGYAIQDSNGTYLYPDASRWVSWSYSLATKQGAAQAVTISGTNSVTMSRSATSGSRNTTSYIRYNSGFSASSSSSPLYLFKENVIPGGYAVMDGSDSYSFATTKFATQEQLENYLRTQIKVYTADDDQGHNQKDTDAYTFDGTVEFTASHDSELKVMYNGVELGTITVSFINKTIVEMRIEQAGTVYVNAGQNTDTGSTITVTYNDGTTDDIPVLLSMVSKKGYNINKVGTYSGLKVNYGGEDLDFTLNVVVNPNLDPFPKNPNEGSVTINKNATGINFKKTGVAQVELSAKGIPYQRGVDVIIMLDTSSSMKRTSTTLGDKRSTVFAPAFKDLIDALQASPSDIKVAIADFNGFNSYTTGAPATPYSRDKNKDSLADNVSYDAENSGVLYTGVNANAVGSVSNLNETAFVDVKTVNSSTMQTKLLDDSTYKSGTNYDYAFWATYQLGKSIKAYNEANDLDRDLVVVFMTDGAPMQYNGYHSQGGSYTWGYWTDGTSDGSYTSLDPDDYLQALTKVTTSEGGKLTTTGVKNTHAADHAYYFGGIGTYAQKHRWNEAVKGSGESYEVIDKLQNTAAGSNQYMTTVPGLGATVYSIGFALDPDSATETEHAERVVKQMATSDDYWFMANSAADLDVTFSRIAGDVIEAATDAHFEDEMGAQFDLRRADFTAKNESTAQHPTIEVVTYDVWQRSDVGKNGVTLDDVGKRKSTTPNVVETVTFSADGSKAYSNLLGSGDIMTSDGLIVAKNFVYNTSDVEKPTKFNGKTITVGAESFYWTLGTITEKEFALRYYVYLTGSMEGGRDAGSYPTNDHATLFYNNYAGADVSQDAPIPVMPWEAAVVKYAAYLVDEYGNIIDTQGNPTGFADRVVVTNPQDGGKILLNGTGTVIDSATVFAEQLPDEYTLFDPTASYTVTAGSDGSGNWQITTGKTKHTTYVTGFGGVDKASNALSGSDKTYDYTATTVWFAVVCTAGAIKDAVVIDYGLPVDISVMSNDMFFDKGTLDSVGNLGTITPEALKAKNGSATKESGFGKSLDTQFGKATVRGNYVRYQVNEMKMTKADIFHYAVDYQGKTQQGYYYGEVAVIPATTIYYEDNFVEFGEGWEKVGETNSTATQDEDRPGEFNLTTIDANNVYGYDRANMECNEYSMGSAQKTTVSKGSSAMPTATFTFTGSAFDVISRTSNTDGVMFVDVVGVDNDTEEYWLVDDYYGYTCAQDGYIKYTWKYGMDEKWHVKQEKLENRVANTDKPADGERVPGESTFVICEPNYTWSPTTASPNALYQIPVIKSPDLGYGTYKVTIYTLYNKFFDHTGAESYDMYLDAIRIYNPTNNTDSTSLDAYKLDKEAYPQYMELRNNLINADTLAVSGSETTGVVFIDGINAVMAQYHEDGDAENYNSTKLDDFTKYGPNNEVYLAKGQAVAFQLTNGKNSESVQLGVKALNGEASIKVDAIGKNNTRDTKAITTKAATDMYYDITNIAAFGTDGNSRVIVITNLGDNLVSLTNIKVTYAQAPTSPAKLMMSAPMARMAADYVSTLYLATFPVATVADGEPTVDQPDDPEVIAPVDPVTPVDPADPEENTTEEPADNTGKDSKKDKKNNGKKDAEKPGKSNKFKPEKMDVTVDKNDIKVGDKVTVTVKTSPDVAAVTVNGEDAKLGATDSTTGEETWTFTAKADEVGDVTNSVVAFDEAGNASEVVDNTDTVQEKEHRTLGQIIMSFIRWIINWISGWFKG